MADDTRPLPEPESDFSAVLAWYLEELDEGRPPDPADVLERHPHIAGRLRDFLADEQQLARVAGPLCPPARAGSQAETLDAVGETIAPPDVPAGGAEFGDYELLEVVARGGMGMVYRARHRRLKRVVALKLLVTGRHATAGERERFRIEAEAASRLSHPGIVQLYEVGEHDGVGFLALEYCGGGSLARKLDGKPLPPAEAARIAAELATAVQAAHAVQVLHRDLKPANVLFGEDGRLKVADFGLAKQLDDARQLTASHAVLGTPPYMAPEQAAGKGHLIGRAVDVYGLGAVLYEMLTGRPPFRGATPLETLAQVLHDDPVPPRKLNPAVPRDLETICLRCLEKNSARRFTSARDVADELGRFLRREPILSRPVGFFARLWRWCRRNPLVAGLLAAVFCALAAGAAVSAGFAVRAERRAGDLAVAKGQLTDALVDARTKTADAVRARNDAKAAEDRAVRERDSAIRQRYAADCARFQIFLDQGDHGRLRELLDRWQPRPDLPDPRGWEWHHYRQQCDRALTVLGPHAGAVTAVAWHPDGRLLAAGYSEGSVRVWNPKTRERVRTLTAHQGEVIGVAWSADGRLATCGEDGILAVWDHDAGTAVFRVAKAHGASRADAIDWSPDGRRLASAGLDGKVRVWDGATGKPVKELLLEGRLNARVRWSHDGRSLAASRSGEVVIWDAATWAEARRWQQNGAIGEAIAWSPDDEHLALGFLTAGVWDARTGQAVVAQLPHDGWVHSLSWGSRGWLATAGRDQTVGVWNPHSGKSVGTLRMHTGVVFSVAWSPDGERLASAGADGTVRVYAPDRRDDASRLVARGSGTASACLGLAWATGDGRLAIVRPGHVKCWSPGGRTVESEAAHGLARVVATAASPDGSRVALLSAEGECALFDPVEGRTVARYKSPLGRSTQSSWCLGFDPSGKRLAGATGFGQIHVWDAETGNPVAARPCPGDGTFGLDWHPGGHRFAVGGQPRTVHLIDAGVGPLKRIDLGTTEIYRVKHSPDGRSLACAGVEGEVFVLDAATGERLYTLRGHTQAVFALAWTADGRRLASAGGDRTIRLWDADTGEQLIALRGHGGKITALAWDRESAVLASADDVGEVRLWTGPASSRPAAEPPAPREPLEVGRWVGHTGTVRDIAVSADGTLAVTCSGWPHGDGTARVWDAAAGKELRQLRGHKGHLSGARFVGAGHQVLITGFDLVVRLWDADTGRLVREFPEHHGAAHALDITADGLTAVTGGNGRFLLAWDVRTGRRTKTWQVPPATPTTHRVLALAVSADGKRVLSGGDTNDLLHIELETGKVLRRFPHGAGIEAAVFSPDERFAVSAGFDGRVVTWDVQTGKPVREFPGHAMWAQAVAFSPDGRLLLTAGKDGTVRLWEFVAGKELHVYRAHAEELWAARFTPDGRRILSAGGSDGDFDVRVLAVPGHALGGAKE